MNDDSLLRALGKLAREQEREAPSEAPPALSSSAAVARCTEAALNALAASASQDQGSANRGLGEDSLGRPPGASWLGRRRNLLLWLAPTLLGAAATAIVILSGVRTKSAIPVYSMEARGGLATTMSAEADVRRPLSLGREAQVDLVLRPDEQVDGLIDARFFLVRGTSIWHWPVSPERAANGSLRVTGVVPAPFGPGPGELVAAIGRPGQMATLTASSLAQPPAGVQVLRWPVSWR